MRNLYNNVSICLFFSVAPVCRRRQQKVYGVAIEEMVHVLCEVEAIPKNVTFQWEFDNSIERNGINAAHITNNWTSSTVNNVKI